MSDTPQQIYTALHGSLAVCAWCLAPFTARVVNGPNADRFCKTRCKDAWWNEERRKQKENPPTAATVAVGEIGQDNNQPQHNATVRVTRQLRESTKIFAVLAELARGTRMTRFDAERLCHDHVLNSTICEIQNRGISVSRTEVAVLGHRDIPTRCVQYWLVADEIAKAAVLLGCKAWRDQS